MPEDIVPFSSVVEAFERWLGGRIWRLVRPFVIDAITPPPRPGPFHLTVQLVSTPGDPAMALKGRVTAQMPDRTQYDPALANHIAKQFLIVHVNGGAEAGGEDRPEVEIPLDATEFELGLFDLGTRVDADLDYENFSKLRGPIHRNGVTVTDTVVPPEPGDFIGFRVEMVDDTPVPTPMPDPTPAPPDVTPPDTGDVTPPDDTV